MLESLINPKRVEKGPWKMFFIGLLYASLSILLVHWFFNKDAVLSQYSGMIVVTFCVMFSLPFMYFIIKQEERQDEEVEGLLGIWKVHRDAIYAFIVPTNIWLLLAIPARYYNVYHALKRKITALFHLCQVDNTCITDSNIKNDLTIKDYFRALFPCGHGIFRQFWNCYFSFKISSWEKLFISSGFRILETKPLLLYSASEFPIIPTTTALTRKGICSSVLFLLISNA